MDMFNEMMKIHKEMDNMFNRMYRSAEPTLVLGDHKGKTPVIPNARIPRVNLIETEQAIEATFEMPGALKDNINLNVTESTLEVEYKNQNELKMNEENVRRHEITSQSFYRQIPLPAKVNPKQVHAKFDNGVLNVKLGKQEEKNGKHNVKVE